MNDWIEMLKNRLFIFGFLFLFLAISGVGLVIYQLNKISTYGMVIDYSGKQRALSQLSAKYSLVSGSETAIYKEKLKKAIDSLDEVLNSLKNGNESVGVVKIEDKEFQAKIFNIKQLWENQKRAMLSQPVDNKEILESSDKILEVANEATTLMANEIKASVHLLVNSVIGGLGLICIFLIYIVVFLKKNIFTPLFKIRLTAQELAKGNLEAKSEIEINNEIGILSNDVDKIGFSLKTLMESIKMAICNLRLENHL